MVLGPATSCRTTCDNAHLRRARPAPDFGGQRTVNYTIRKYDPDLHQEWSSPVATVRTHVGKQRLTPKGGLGTRVRTPRRPEEGSHASRRDAASGHRQLR